MAQVTFLGPEDQIRHSCPSGSGKEYNFEKGRPMDVSDKKDVIHYMTSGGFSTKITPLEAAYFYMKKAEHNLKDDMIISAAGLPLKKIQEQAKEKTEKTKEEK